MTDICPDCAHDECMVEAIRSGLIPLSGLLREMILAAGPFAEIEPKPDWPCHGRNPEQFNRCAHCRRVRLLRDVIRWSEEALS